MSFGLKNVGATYQCTVTVIFHDLIHKTLEDYVDDILVKSLNALDHLSHLEEVFDWFIKYNLMLNPKTFVFDVTSGKLLRFIVSWHGIEIDPKKVKAIIDMAPHKNSHSFSLFKGNYNQLDNSSLSLLISANHFHICSKKMKILSGIPFANATLN